MTNSQNLHDFFNMYRSVVLGSAHPDISIEYCGLKLCAEAGELAQEIAHLELPHHEDEFDRFIDEAGDVLWFLCMILDFKGATLEEAFAMNMQKMKIRYPLGWTYQGSKHR